MGRAEGFSIMADFIGDTDAGILAFASNFSSVITSAPLPLGLTVLQATALAGLVSSYSAALTASTDPSTRGPAAVLSKEEKKRLLISNIRLLARIIQANPAVTNDQRFSLGLPIRRVPSPIPQPGEAPDVDVKSVSGRTIICRIHRATGSRRGKPPGVAGANVYSHVGPTPPASLNDWTLEGHASRPNAVEIVLPADVPGGSTVWICANWYNPRGQAGPTSAPVSTNIPGGVTAMPPVPGEEPLAEAA
jgi:hypothetical protein